MTTKHKTREAWLTAALWGFIDAHFVAAGYEVPSNIRVACGFPAAHALARKHLRIGECWAMTESTDKTFEIFVSPLKDEPLRVLGILIHEVVHATVGLDHGHKRPFSKCAKAVGLLSPWTATSESDDLKIDLASWVKTLGSYPHARIDPTSRKTQPGKPEETLTSNPTQTTRMRLLHCEACGCKVRTTWKWLERYGDQWPCPCGEILASMDSKEAV